jgi:hypothetical protein
MHTTSWVDHGLNEVLWAVILRGNLEQRQCLKIFRQTIVAARGSDPLYRDTFISHSALSALGKTEFDIIMAPVLQDNSARELLRCLLFLESIPDRPHWARHLEEPDTDTHSQFIMKGVASCLDHQSQEATDVRWMKLMYCIIVQQRMHFPESMSEIVEGLRLYPDYGDQHAIRPHVRAGEIGLRGILSSPQSQPATSWW